RPSRRGRAPARFRRSLTETDARRATDATCSKPKIVRGTSLGSEPAHAALKRPVSGALSAIWRCHLCRSRPCGPTHGKACVAGAGSSLDPLPPPGHLLGDPDWRCPAETRPRADGVID